MLFSQTKPYLSQIGFLYDLPGYKRSFCITNSMKAYISGGHGFIRVIDCLSGELIDIIEKEVKNANDFNEKYDINIFDVSSDEKYLCNEDLEIWNLEEKKVVMNLQNSDTLKLISDIIYSPDDKYIAAISYGYGDPGNYGIDLWEAANGTHIRTLNVPKVNDICFGDSSDVLYYVTEYSDVFQYNVASNDTALIFNSPEVHTNTMSISPNCKYLIMINFGGGFKVIDIKNKKEILDIDDAYASMPVFSGDNNTIIYGSYSDNKYLINFLNLSKKKIERQINADYWIINTAISEDNKNLLVTDYYRTDIINIETGVSMPLISHAYTVNTIAYHSDNEHIITIDLNYSNAFIIIQRFNTTTKKRDWIVEGYTVKDNEDYMFYPAKLSPDGKLFVFLTNGDKNVVLLDAETGTAKYSFKTDIPIIAEFDFSADGRYLYVLGRKGILQVWDLTTSSKINEYNLGYQPVSLKASIFSNMIYLFMGEDKNSTNLFSLDLSTKKIKQIENFQPSLAYFHKPYSFSGDSRYFASVSTAEQAIKIYDLVNGKVLKLLNVGNSTELDDIKMMAFTNDNKRLVIARDENRSIDFRNIATGVNEYTVPDYLYPQINSRKLKICKPLTTALSFSSDGRYFAIGNEDPGVLIYETSTLGVNDNENNETQNTSVFPNPAEEYITIPVNCVRENVTICNALGQLQAVMLQNTDPLQIDVSALPAGVYYINIDGAIKMFVKK